MAHGGDRRSRSEPGIAEVAKVAGVSYMTVSRVVNGREGVGQATRDRVLKLIDELGYRPNAAARALRTGRSRSIGIICFATPLHGPASYLFSVEQAARSHGFSVSIITLDVLDSAAVYQALTELRELAVEAIIVIAPHRISGEALRDRPIDIPVVAIWGPEETAVPVTGLDHTRAAAMVTQYLLDLGHPTVHHVSGPADWTGSDLRVTGWRQTLEAAGREIPPVRQGDWLASSGYRAGLELLTDPAVSAVFLSNDQMALGLMAAARELGRRIPEDLSVVGYDNEPGSAYFVPPLTTVNQDFALVGRRAFALAEELIESGEPASSQVDALVPTFVERQSAGPYRSFRTD